MNQKILTIVVPLVLCALDVVFGYASAMKRGELNSTVMRDGLWNKLAEVFAIVAGEMVEVCISVYGSQFLKVDLDMPVCTAVCAYISLYELTSIVENIGKMNKTIGVWLTEKLGFESYKVGLVKVDADDVDSRSSDDDSSRGSRVDAG